MFKWFKGKPPAEEPQSVARLGFFIYEDAQVKIDIDWDKDLEKFSPGVFVRVVDLLNSGQLFKTIKNVIIKYGEESDQSELASVIATTITDPDGDDEIPLVSAVEVTKHHFSQNNLNLEE